MFFGSSNAARFIVGPGKHRLKMILSSEDLLSTILGALLDGC